MVSDGFRRNQALQSGKTKPFRAMLGSVRSFSLRRTYVWALFRFAFRNNPLLYLSLAISVVSVCLELAAMTALMPLASLSAGQPNVAGGIFVQLLVYLKLPIDGRSLLLVFIALFAARALTQFVSQGLTIYLGKRILLQLTTRAFSALMRSVPMRELESKSIGYYIALSGDEAARSSNVVVFVSQFLSTALLGALYYFAIVSYSRIVALAVLVFLVVTFLALFESFRISHRLGVRQVSESQAVNSLFIDAVNSLRSVRTYSAEDYITDSHFKQMLRYLRTSALIEITSMSARLGPVLFLFLCAAAVALWPAAGDTLSFNLPFVVTIVILLMRFFPIVGQALNLALRVIADARAGRDVTQIIDEYGRVPRRGYARQHIDGPVDRIEVVDVHFEHIDGKPVLRDFNTTLQRGVSYAIVGASGSGKSTLLDLFLGFHAPAQGEILINGISLDQLDPLDLRSKVILAAQDVAIFNDTVANNLRLGLDVPQEEIERACRIACIDEFIAGLSGGYDTVLNYKGSNLSGGQKQRIGIARAVLRHPDVLLLDESTSALDSTTRERVVENLLNEFNSCILVFVTHDAFVMSQVDAVLNLSPVDEETTAPRTVSTAREF
jgi:ABC-type bacteriocin/lantibiotic exporter with double-glycine peptidase domain